MTALHTRSAWVVAGALVLVAAAVFLMRHGPAQVPFLPECLFHRFTGLNCPGCGMTRATHAALHGRLGEAFRMNPVGMMLFPVAMSGIGLEIVGWVRGRPLSFRLNPGIRGTWCLVALVFAFWFLRNLPWYPFTLLSPPV